MSKAKLSRPSLSTNSAEFLKSPLSKLPVTVTINKIGKYYFVDSSYDEEPLIEARLTAGVTKEGNVCALQKGGSGLLSEDEVSEMLRLAIDKSRELGREIN